MAQVALITGCSRGIGQLTAQLFAARGWQVVATARNRADIDIDNVFPVALDVTDDASISSAVDAALARFGSIDVLVNNAGIGMLGPLEGSCAEELESHFRTNFFGPVSLIRQVLPTMRERQTGTIVNVSSIAGRIATPFMPAYHASKFAVEGLSESLRYELAAQVSE